MSNKNTNDDEKKDVMPKQTKSIYVFGTFDTKGDEIMYLYRLICNRLCKWSEPSVANTTVKLVDMSTQKCLTYSDKTQKNDTTLFCVDYTCKDIISNWEQLSKLNRNESNAKITNALHEFVKTEYAKNAICGVISVGGSCATAMASSIFTQNLPLGLPKLIISTVAASSMGAEYIGHSDLILMPSIVDISGVSDIYKIIASNAASAIIGMSQSYALNEIEKAFVDTKSIGFTVGITMFGITTKCVEAVKSALYKLYGIKLSVLIFHATGTGGKCMEYLIENGFINAVIDITTTEVADYIANGILSCDESRFDAARKRKIPTILSLGALNCVNFGAKSSISNELLEDKERIFQVHNEQVTLMKANDDELTKMAQFIAKKMNKYESVSMMIPNDGISALDAKGSTSPFAKFKESDLKTLKATLDSEIQNKNQIKYVDAHINDDKFANEIVKEFSLILEKMSIEIGTNDDKKTAKLRKKEFVSSKYLRNGRRKDIISSFYEQINSNIPIVGGGAGTGISAKCEVMGGADLVIIYNSGKYRMAGRGSLAGLLPFGDANEIVKDMANEVIPVVHEQNKMVPVIAGVNGTDPFKNMDVFISEIKAMGFDGIQNFPTVGLIDGKFRTNLEETGFGYDKEVEIMRIAKDKYDLITTPYVFNVSDAVKMAQVGVDIIVIHLGLTVGGNIGAKTLGMNLDDCIDQITVIANAIYSVNENQIVLVHGGPVAQPKDVEYILSKLPKGMIDGFYGASSMERLPVEVAITNTLKQFKSLKL